MSNIGNIITKFIDSQKTTGGGNINLQKLTTLERNALTPLEGDQVYDTTLDELCVYNGSNWFYKSYVLLALNSSMSSVGTSGTKITNLTVSHYPSSQNNISISSGDITLQPGFYKIECMASFLNTTNTAVERSCSITFRRGTTELFRNSTSIDWLDGNNTAGSANLSFIVESTNVNDLYSFRAFSDSNGTAQLTSSFRAVVERIR